MSTSPDRFCRHCGTKLAQESTFCTVCGSPVTEPSPPAPEQSASSSHQDNLDTQYAVTDQPLKASSSNDVASQNDVSPPTASAGASLHAAPSQEGVQTSQIPSPPPRPGGVGCLLAIMGFLAFGAISGFFADQYNIIFGVMAVVAILLMWGLWRMQIWAYWVTLAAAIFFLAVGLWNWWIGVRLYGGNANLQSADVSIFYAVVMLIALSRSKTRAAFRNKKK